MIFLDTSAVFALANNKDEHHEEAKRAFASAWRAGEQIVTHGYVLCESAALLHNRLGHASALSFLKTVSNYSVRWISQELHAEAVEEFAIRQKPGLSFVDVTSFLVMRREGITSYLGYDKHFEEEGFTQVVAQE